MTTDEHHSVLQHRIEVLEEENAVLKETATRHEHQDAFYRHLYENAPVGMYELDFLTGRCVSVNRTVLEYTGYSREEFMAMNLVDFLADESRQRFFERLAKIQRGEEVPTSVEFQIKVKDGRTIWALLEIQFIRQGDRFRGASVVLYNIDEIKRAALALEESEERFRKLVETMNEGLIILDQDGHLTYVNKHLEDISGFAAEELVGRKIHEFLSPEASRLIYRKLNGKENDVRRSFEIAWHRKNGQKRYSIVSPQILGSGETGIGGSFAIITDFTAKKQAENALRRRERELQEKNDRLEEMNTALQTLVKMREKDREDIENALSANLKRLIEPLIEKLQNSGLTDRQKMIVTLLSANLAEMSASHSKGLSSRFLVLTPVEMEVANFVRHGRTTKEIATLMNISSRTVDMHRLNIRRKLGIHRTGTNLRSFLLSV